MLPTSGDFLFHRVAIGRLPAANGVFFSMVEIEKLDDVFNERGPCPNEGSSSRGRNNEGGSYPSESVGAGAHVNTVSFYDQNFWNHRHGCRIKYDPRYQMNRDRAALFFHRYFVRRFVDDLDLLTQSFSNDILELMLEHSAHPGKRMYFCDEHATVFFRHVIDQYDTSESTSESSKRVSTLMTIFGRIVKRYPAIINTITYLYKKNEKNGTGVADACKWIIKKYVHRLTKRFVKTGDRSLLPTITQQLDNFPELKLLKPKLFSSSDMRKPYKEKYIEQYNTYYRAYKEKKTRLPLTGPAAVVSAALSADESNLIIAEAIIERCRDTKMIELSSEEVQLAYVIAQSKLESSGHDEDDGFFDMLEELSNEEEYGDDDE